MIQSELAQCMDTLGFSELERKIYLALLRGGTMSAYQIAKEIAVSRPSVYAALDRMVRRGMAELIPNDTALYAAQRPEILLGHLRADFNRSADAAARLLKDYAPPAYGEQFVNLKGYDVILERVKELLRRTDSEIYLNTDMPLDALANELRSLAERGIRAVVFSFYDIGCGVPCDLYSHCRPLGEHAPSRLMAVSDGSVALLAGSGGDGTWQATVSGSPLFVKVLSEHIHNDIYLLRLRDKFGRGIYGDLHIATDYENRNRSQIYYKRSD